MEIIGWPGTAASIACEHDQSARGVEQHFRSDSESGGPRYGQCAIDDTVRAGFQAVRVAVRINGPETPQRDAELQEAVDAHCPVLDSTTGVTPVNTTLEVG